MDTISNADQKIKFGLVYFLICLLLGWSFIAWAYSGFTQGEPDSLWFLPPAVSYHNGTGLYNKLHEPAQVFDPAHQQRFLFYTPGFQLILSTILPEATGRGAFVALAFVNFMSLILSAILFYRVLKGQRLFLGILGMIAFSTYFCGMSLGRPDYLATLIVLLMIFVQMSLQNSAQIIFSSVLLGVLAFVHPVAALFVSALLGIRYAYDFSFVKTILKMAGICAGGLGLFILLMAMSPFGLKDSFQGIFLHAENTMEHGTPYPLLKYWIMHSYASCYGILFMAAVGVVVWMLWQERKKIVSKIGVILFGMILAAFFYRFVGIAWDRCYNLWIFSPLMIAVLLAAVEKIQKQKIFSIFVSVVLFLCTIGYFHSAALFGFYLKYGYQYAEARNDFQKFMREHPRELVGVSKSLWTLSEDYGRMRSFGLNPAHLRCKPHWIFLQQRFALKYTPEPPIVEGYELVSHNFTAQRPMIFGLQLSPTMPGYFYAVYHAKN